jgi:cysteinyl-tRNA synthetase
MQRLYDSALGRVVDVVPRRDREYSMYVCGPTVYELPHIGHGRAVLTWDVLRRWLTFRGSEVVHVANVTDIDDNIIGRAMREDRTESDVASEFEAAWWAAMDALGSLRPTSAPHATEFVDGMIELVGTLLDRGHAYRTSDGVYLDTSSVEGYGLLAGQPLDSLRAGARIEASEEKRSPFDFALWKAAKPGEPAWDTPFGRGRPGWHTECVVMSLDLLGEDFDLHCGGQDLRFPHHENERAQAVALHRSFSRHWIHHGWVMVEGEKMSKSLHNYTSLTDLLAKTDPRAYRLLVLRAHYRAPIEVTADSIEDAERALSRLDALARRFELAPLDLSDPLRPANREELDANHEFVGRFTAAMDDDLNTPTAIATLFELVTRANALSDGGDFVGASLAARAVATLAGSVGLVLGDNDAALDDRATQLAAERAAARVAGDYAAADRLRDELVALGFVSDDTPKGTKVRRADGGR